MNKNHIKPKTKSTFVAGILALILTGLGHAYLGDLKRAAWFFFGQIGAFFIFPPLAIIVWGWNIIDAVAQAQRYGKQISDDSSDS